MLHPNPETNFHFWGPRLF